MKEKKNTEKQHKPEALKIHAQRLRTSHDLDDGLIIFDFDIRFTEPEEMHVSSSFLLTILLPYIKEIHPLFLQLL